MRVAIILFVFIFSMSSYGGKLNHHWVLKCKGDLQKAKLMEKSEVLGEGYFTIQPRGEYIKNCNLDDYWRSEYTSLGECLEGEGKKYDKGKAPFYKAVKLNRMFRKATDACQVIPQNTLWEEGGFHYQLGNDISLLLRGKSLEKGKYNAVIVGKFLDRKAKGNCGSGISYTLKKPIITTKTISVVKKIEKDGSPLKFDLLVPLTNDLYLYDGVTLEIEIRGPNKFYKKFSFDQTVGWDACC